MPSTMRPSALELEQDAPPLFTELRPSKKRTRDDESQGNPGNVDLYVPNISNTRVVTPQFFPRYTKETSPSKAKFLYPPNITKCLGSNGSGRLNIDVRPRLRAISAKKRRVIEQKQVESWTQGQNPFNSGIPEDSSARPKHLPALWLKDSQSQSYTPLTSGTPSPFSPPEVSPYHAQQSQHQADTPPSTPVLAPCHICHRRPTTRSVLDAYADCELCAERTCYICLRECNGPECRSTGENTSANADGSTKIESVAPADAPRSDSIARKVCSWCAVEGITECGMDVAWCLDCVQLGEGDQMRG